MAPDDLLTYTTAWLVIMLDTIDVKLAGGVSGLPLKHLTNQREMVLEELTARSSPRG